ncbi:hypothetical protein BIW11_00214 [Tropilaelaps mercedesae]|uniref:Protein FRA10AC1-like n=1 Tax=Tropilaelaps mercedesae TaxID=418985 RepID=A0A1V9XZV3_9ACAR|nr:hypothetical protein BIW11_00214 [Tropilaelaps mercedesae]
MSDAEYTDNLVACSGNDYDSSFESDRGTYRKTNSGLRSTNDILPPSVPSTASSNGDTGNIRVKDCAKHFCSEQSREEKRREKYAILALDAYSRHKKLVNDYFLCYKGQTAQLKRDTSKDKTDTDILKENHRFLWDDADSTSLDLTWGQRLAKKYYDKLFKEYCITDLRFYKENKIAFRWRTNQEVVIGKGQFNCGEKTCKSDTELRSWEVNFAYIERGERKNALVKVRLCDKCSLKLNHRKQRKEVTKIRKKRAAEGLSSNEKHSHSKRSKTNKVQSEKRRKNKFKREKRGHHLIKDSVVSSSSEDEEYEDAERVETIEEKRIKDDNPWAKPAHVEKEPNLEDEYDAFLDDMFL